MNSIELLQSAFADLHGVLRADIAEIGDVAWWWQPAADLNSAGFIAWHLVRDEDTVLSFLAQRDQIWARNEWASRFGMDATEQGTGMAPVDAGALRYPRDQFLAYAEEVWQATGPAVATLGAEALRGPAWPGSGWTVATQLVEGCLGHSWLHLGEIRLLKGLQGWRGPE